MADFGNQLEGAGEKAEGLAGAFDNLMIKAAGLAGLEEKKIKADQKSFKLQAQQDREKKKAIPLQKKMTIQLQQRLKHSTLLNKGLKETIKSMNLLGKTMSGMKKGMGAVGKGIGAIGMQWWHLNVYLLINNLMEEHKVCKLKFTFHGQNVKLVLFK